MGAQPDTTTFQVSKKNKKRFDKLKDRAEKSSIPFRRLYNDDFFTQLLDEHEKTTTHKEAL